MFVDRLEVSGQRLWFLQLVSSNRKHDIIDKESTMIGYKGDVDELTSYSHAFPEQGRQAQQGERHD